MKRKHLITPLIIMALALTFSMISFVSAADNNTISIKLDGKTLTIADTQLAQDKRTYAPYDTLFKALGATVSYDKESETVTGSLDGIDVTFTLGFGYIEVNGQYFYNDATPFEDSATGKIYIPVRFTAQALGYVVGWDSETKCISLQSVDKLIDTSGATYDIIDKYIDYQNALADKKLEVSGTFGANLDMAPSGDSIPLDILCSLEGLIDKGNAEINVSVETNASDFIKGFLSGEEIDKQTLAFLSLLNNIDLDVILNNDSGIMYIQSSLVSTLLGQDPTTWLSMDLNTLLSDASLGGYAQSAISADSFKDILSSVLKMLCINDTNNLTLETLSTINSIISDQAMVKDGEDYVAVFEADIDGAVISIEITFDFDGVEFCGVIVDASMDMGEDGYISLYYIDDSTGYEFAEIAVEIPYYMDIYAYMEFSYTETDKSPSAKPADGSKVAPIDDIVPYIEDIELF